MTIEEAIEVTRKAKERAERAIAFCKTRYLTEEQKKELDSLIAEQQAVVEQIEFEISQKGAMLPFNLRPGAPVN